MRDVISANYQLGSAYRQSVVILCVRASVTLNCVHIIFISVCVAEGHLLGKSCSLV